MTAFDASGHFCLQMPADEAPQDVIERPRVTVARQDLEDGEPPYLCVSLTTPEKRFVFSVEFNDVARLGSILMARAVAEQLRQEGEHARAFEAVFDDGDDPEF